MNETKNFAVYSKDGCPYCSKVVQVLELAELNHVVYKLDRNFDSQSFYGEFDTKIKKKTFTYERN